LFASRFDEPVLVESAAEWSDKSDAEVGKYFVIWLHRHSFLSRILPGQS